MKTFSPYAAAKIVNIWLDGDGINKKLPPQMIYQYVTKGYIEHLVTEAGKKVVSEQALAIWYAKYTKKTETVEEVQETEEVTDLEVDGVPIDDEQTILFEA